MRVLVIEDDIDLSSTIKHYLQKRQYSATQVYDGDIAYNMIIDDGLYDLYLVDLRLPGVQGLKLTELIRQTYPSANIIIITAESDDNIMKKGYQLGCDQYIKKPLSFIELDAKISFFTEKSKRLINLIEGVDFDPSNSKLIVSKGQIKLSNLEVQLIDRLLVERGTIVKTETLCEELWGRNYHDCKIRQLVSRLKSKAECLDDIIHNIKGQGYRVD